MASPDIFALGTGVTATAAGVLQVPIPAGIIVGDVLAVHMMIRTSQQTLTVSPSGVQIESGESTQWGSPTGAFASGGTAAQWRAPESGAGFSGADFGNEWQFNGLSGVPATARTDALAAIARLRSQFGNTVVDGLITLRVRRNSPGATLGTLNLDLGTDNNSRSSDISTGYQNFEFNVGTVPTTAQVRSTGNIQFVVHGHGDSSNGVDVGNPFAELDHVQLRVTFTDAPPGVAHPEGWETGGNSGVDVTNGSRYTSFVWFKRASSADVAAAGSGTYGFTVLAAQGINLVQSHMVAFRGVKLDGTFREATAASQGNSNQVQPPPFSTFGPDRLGVAFVAVGDDNLLDAFTGGTGGTWTEPLGEFRTTVGSDGALQVQGIDVPAPATISGASDVMAAADPWMVITTALIPEPAAVAATFIGGFAPPHAGLPF